MSKSSSTSPPDCSDSSPSTRIPDPSVSTEADRTKSNGPKQGDAPDAHEPVVDLSSFQKTLTDQFQDITTNVGLLHGFLFNLQYQVALPDVWILNGIETHQTYREWQSKIVAKLLTLSHLNESTKVNYIASRTTWTAYVVVEAILRGVYAGPTERTEDLLLLLDAWFQAPPDRRIVPATP